MLSMTVAVWTLDSNVGTYVVSPRSIRTITLQTVSTLPKIFCVEEVLDVSEYVLVSQGDIIGVVLPSSNPIPLLSSNSGSGVSLLKHSQDTSAMNLTSSQFTTMSGTALHLYATIG